MKRLFFIFICLFLLTSCWSRREFNELSIAYGLGIDKEDGEYIVSAQVINPEQISGQSSSHRVVDPVPPFFYMKKEVRHYYIPFEKCRKHLQEKFMWPTYIF